MLGGWRSDPLTLEPGASIDIPSRYSEVVRSDSGIPEAVGDDASLGDDASVGENPSEAPPSPHGEHDLIVVLGMHRSGTSALTEALAEAGLRLTPAEHLDQAHESTERGSVEDTRVVALNNWILAQHGASWDRPWTMRRARPSERELKSVTTLWDTMAAEGVTVLKDPRLALTLPWWRHAWAQAGTRVKFVEIVRHPSQVAGSLLSRDGIPLAYGELLWKEYIEQAASNTGAETVHRVWHQELLRDAPAVLERLTQELGIPAGSTTGASVERGLQHQFSDLPPVLWQVRALWAALRGGSGSSPVGAETADLETLAENVISLLRTSQADAQIAANLQGELDDARARSAGFESELNRVHAAFAASHAEATRVHEAYTETQVELAQMQRTYAETHAELNRIRAAYEENQAQLARVTRSRLGRWLARSTKRGQ